MEILFIDALLAVVLGVLFALGLRPLG